VSVHPLYFSTRLATHSTSTRMVSKRAPDGNGSTQSDRTLVCLTTMPIPVRVPHFELTLASANDALNAVEDFAQIGVVSLFANVNPGGLDPAFGWTWHCLLNQFTIYNAFQSDSMTPGGVCTRRWADSATISTRAAKTAPGGKYCPSLEMFWACQVFLLFHLKFEQMIPSSVHS